MTTATFTFVSAGARVVITRHSVVAAGMKMGQVLQELGSQIYLDDLAARVTKAVRELFNFLRNPYIKALPAAALQDLAIIWVESMYSLVAQNEREEAVDLLFEKIDDLLLENRTSDVDNIIRLIDIQRLDSYTLVGLLSVTLWSKDQLRYRAIMVKRIEEHFTRTDPERVEGLMSGLR